jgi:hypothetical protein
MPGRSYSSGSKYRYGFNGQENSDEIAAGLTTAMYWEYDSRIGRRWNVDPLLKPDESSYLTFGGNPILNTDVNGDDAEGPGDPPTIWERLWNSIFGEDKQNISDGIDNIREGAKKQAIGPWDNHIFNDPDAENIIAIRKADGLTQGLGGVGQLSEGIYSAGAKTQAILEAPMLIKGSIQLLRGKTSQTLFKTLANKDVKEIQRIKNYLNEPIPVKVGPKEPYKRGKHYGKTPTAADRKALGAKSDEVLDHTTPLVRHYYEGDGVGGKPGHQMTEAERKAFAKDRSKMQRQKKSESTKQGAEMSRYSREQKKKNNL